MTRYRADDLTADAQQLLCAAGLAETHARHLAQAIVAADLLGFSSHGLALLPRYLDELADGRIAKIGEPEIVRDNGSSLLIEGHMLPGAAVVNAALDHMLGRLAASGSVTAIVRRSHHIGCLSTYLERATSRGLTILIMSSNPHARIVAPFGGTRPAYSPNPIACGIPTAGDPILIDTSMGSISFNRCREYRERGEELPNTYLFDNQGRPTRDPNALMTTPPGAVRPFGGDDLGYKGFALGLMIEAFTAGLAGFGRSDAPASSSNTVFILDRRSGPVRRRRFLPARDDRAGGVLPRRDTVAGQRPPPGRACAGAPPRRDEPRHRDRSKARRNAGAARAGTRCSRHLCGRLSTAASRFASNGEDK